VETTKVADRVKEVTKEEVVIQEVAEVDLEDLSNQLCLTPDQVLCH
jgi:hypothetical protein